MVYGHSTVKPFQEFMKDWFWFALSSIEVELYSEVFFWLKNNDNDRLLDSGFSASLA